MRKMTVEFVPDRKYITMVGSEELVDCIEQTVILDILKIDFEKGMKLVLAEVTLKRDMELEDVPYPKDVIEIIAVLRKEGRRITAIIKTSVPDVFRGMMKELDLDVIWDVPVIKSVKRVVQSVIGEEKELRRYLEVIKRYGTITNVSFKGISLHEHGMLSDLTEKQREVILTAKRLGYYEYPRKVNSEQVARKLGLAKATVIEHLRKAEKRLLMQVLAGY